MLHLDSQEMSTQNPISKPSAPPPSTPTALLKVSGEMSHLLPFCLESKHNLRHPVVLGVGKNHRQTRDKFWLPLTMLFWTFLAPHEIYARWNIYNCNFSSKEAKVIEDILLLISLSIMIIISQKFGTKKKMIWILKNTLIAK